MTRFSASKQKVRRLSGRWALCFRRQRMGASFWQVASLSAVPFTRSVEWNQLRRQAHMRQPAANKARGERSRQTGTPFIALYDDCIMKPVNSTKYVDY